LKRGKVGQGISVHPHLFSVLAVQARRRKTSALQLRPPATGRLSKNPIEIKRTNKIFVVSG
jgi:hypothetical protein